VDEAIGLVERDGEDGLSMRRLGSALGVKAMSLYHHVGGREELVDAMAARTFEGLQDLDVTRDWHATLTDFGRSLRDVALVRPRTFRLVGVQPLDAPHAVAERLVQALVEAGLDRAGALALYRAVASFARGYALGEAGGFTIGADEVDADLTFERGLAAVIRGFEADFR
jgi:TetR/AcrR family transcriptional regulator, tetracycline repressor protein